jgi:hypothetical protein
VSILDSFDAVEQMLGRTLDVPDNCRAGSNVVAV